MINKHNHHLNNIINLIIIMNTRYKLDSMINRTMKMNKRMNKRMNNIMNKRMNMIIRLFKNNLYFNSNNI